MDAPLASLEISEHMKKDSKSKKHSRKKEQPEPRFSNLLAQGTHALQNGEISIATRLLERAHQLDPENVDAALNLGGAYILSRKFARAVAILEPLSERDPDNPMVWTNLGAAYLGNPVLARAEEQGRAIAAFERALAINSTTPNVAYNLGLIYLDRQENGMALHWFRQALQTDPNDRDARNYIVQLTSQGDGYDI
jgi:tetratricopeptide (TPR) repeat protein